MSSPSKTTRLMRGGEAYGEWIANRCADHSEIDKFRSRAYFRRKKAFQYAVHKWQLHIGDHPIGPVIEMTGGESAGRNRKLAKAFITELDRNPNARLKQWRRPQQEERE